MSFSDEIILKVEDTAIFQEEYPVLRNVNFEMHKGEFVYLIGKTGSGKSSLLKTLYADIRLKQGIIQIAGFELRHIKKSNIPYLRRRLGVIFQDFQLLTDRSVADNLTFLMKAVGITSTTKIKQRLSDVLMQVGLAGATAKYPYQLSGGEQQRIAIARALINEPTLLIADEPTGNLDPEVADEIMKLFIDINHSGTAILMATHHHHFLTRYPKRTLLCADGLVKDINAIE
ncbi:MAG: ATP-binding cassette domain-containing protein [Cytophagales bacterium]|nr:ATP-binding cassette domain-containing protein [Cytophagales bacterium]